MSSPVWVPEIRFLVAFGDLIEDFHLQVRHGRSEDVVEDMEHPLRPAVGAGRCGAIDEVLAHERAEGRDVASFDDFFIEMQNDRFVSIQLRLGHRAGHSRVLGSTDRSCVGSNPGRDTPTGAAQVYERDQGDDRHRRRPSCGRAGLGRLRLGRKPLRLTLERAFAFDRCPFLGGDEDPSLGELVEGRGGRAKAMSPLNLGVPKPLWTRSESGPFAASAARPGQDLKAWFDCTSMQ